MGEKPPCVSRTGSGSLAGVAGGVTGGLAADTRGVLELIGMPYKPMRTGSLPLAAGVDGGVVAGNVGRVPPVLPAALGRSVAVAPLLASN